VPVTFWLYDLEFYFFFLNDVDISCSFQFKNGFGKYDPAFPKHKCTFIRDTNIEANTCKLIGK